MARRGKRKGGGEEPENAERWLLTYADMITLLMAFFIMMYSMSVLNLQKFQEVAFSIRSGFGGIMKGRGEAFFDHQKPKSKDGDGGAKGRAKMQQVGYDLRSYITSEGLENEVEIREDQRGLTISVIAEPLMFDRGSAALRLKADRLLNKVVAEVYKLANDIQVEGHTCSLPISSALYPSNWELSTARASTVVRYFEGRGINGKRLSAIGYGDTRPRVPNDSEAHRAYNRRVDIVILNSAYGVVGSSKQAASHVAVTTVEKQSIKPILKKVWSTTEMSEEEGAAHE